MTLLFLIVHPYHPSPNKIDVAKKEPLLEGPKKFITFETLILSHLQEDPGFLFELLIAGSAATTLARTKRF